MYSNFMHILLTKRCSWWLQTCRSLPDLATANVCKVDTSNINHIERSRWMKWLITRLTVRYHCNMQTCFHCITWYWVLEFMSSMTSYLKAWFKNVSTSKYLSRMALHAISICDMVLKWSPEENCTSKASLSVGRVLAIFLFHYESKRFSKTLN